MSALLTERPIKSIPDKNIRAENRPDRYLCIVCGLTPQKRRVYELVARKRRLEEPATPPELALRQQIGSKGWHTRGYLPHFDAPGTLQFVTFRLADAMPASRRSEWEALLKIENEREKRIKLEEYLDRGCGGCVLRQPHLARALEDVLLRFDGQRYRLAAWVIMPNHAHVLVELWTVPMSKLIKSWKGASSRNINRLLGRRDELWQADYWDRSIRDETHFRKARNYVESNPVKAGLTSAATEWPFSSANSKWLWTAPNRYTSAQLVSLAEPRSRPDPKSTLYTSAGIPVTP